MGCVDDTYCRYFVDSTSSIFLGCARPETDEPPPLPSTSFNPKYDVRVGPPGLQDRMICELPVLGELGSQRGSCRTR